MKNGYNHEMQPVEDKIKLKHEDPIHLKLENR